MSNPPATVGAEEKTTLSTRDDDPSEKMSLKDAAIQARRVAARAEEERAEAASSEASNNPTCQMVWTTTPPSEAGWYWVRRLVRRRNFAEFAPRPVRFDRVPDGDGGHGVFPFGPYRVTQGLEFAGPLPLPQEAS